MRKYYNIFKFQLKSEANFKTDYIFKVISFLIHIFVLNELWDFLLKDKQILGYSKSDLIWYVIIAEAIMYITGPTYKKIAYSIRSGEIVNLITKPVNIAKYIIAMECTNLINGIINIIFAIILGLIMGGFLKITILQILMFLISFALSAMLAILFQVIVGMSAFITQENSSIYLVLQKLILIVVLTPIDFFQNTMQNILKVLPTTYIVYPAGKIFIHFNAKESLILISLQVISLLIFLGTVYFLNEKGVKKINVNGG